MAEAIRTTGPAGSGIIMAMPGLNPDYFPQSALDLIEDIGLEATIKIVEQRGGVRLFVPVKAKSDHWLMDCIGQDSFEQLVLVSAGLEIEIPRCCAALRALRESEIHAGAQSGETNAVLALRFGYTERGIRKVRRRVEEREGYESPQRDLF